LNRKVVLPLLLPSLLLGALAIAGPARAAGPGLSGSQEYGGNTVTWATAGASAATGALAESYDGVVAPGAAVTFSGSMSFVIGAGAVTNLSQSASLSGAATSVSFSQRVGEGTYTTPFNLSAKAPSVPKGQSVTTGQVIGSITAYAESRNCNDSGVCGGPQISLDIAVVVGASSATPTPPPGGTDTTPPVVSIKPDTHVYAIGKRFPVTFTVTDDSKQASWLAFLYSGGTPIAKGQSGGLVSAKGRPIHREWGRQGGSSGPFYYCIQATDAAGNSSDIACQWVSGQVKVGPISNGCGTALWGSAPEWVMNYYGDVRSYGFENDQLDVIVRNACNVHDAAYAGATIYDPFSKSVIDFRTWSRSRIDAKFREDIQRICRREIGTAIRKQDLLKTCLNGVTLANLTSLITLQGPGKAGESVGANTYWELVRTFAAGAYDADVTVPGTQSTTPEQTLPPGGARVND
jgi:hypothetical protein